MAMRGLIIKQEFLDLILCGRKDWELRGSPTNVAGAIALIQAGSGTIVGRADLDSVFGPLSLGDLKANASHLGCRPAEVSKYYPKTYAWVLKNAKRLKRPIPYRHPQGAVIWVKLNRAVATKLK
jgi:hypothetical protein